MQHDFDFIGQKSQNVRIRDQLSVDFAKVFDHCKFILGPEVTALEEQLAEFAGVGHCITCANGTDALQIVQMALGIGPTSSVIAPAFTYIATAETARLLHADLTYADVKPTNFNIDPQMIEPLVKSNTQALIVTSLFGQTPDFEAINRLDIGQASIVEDAAQSFGARHHGKRSGALSRVATTSFFPTKPLGCYGDGGAIFTDDDDLAIIMRQIARHGQAERYDHIRLGVNSRLDTLQAAVLLRKLEHFEEELQRRDEVAQRYNSMIGDVPGLIKPSVDAYNTSAWAQYTLRCVDQDRDGLVASMKARGVPVAVYYPKGLNKQPSVADPRAHTPVSNMLARSVISLPMHPYLTPQAQSYVVDCLHDALS